MKAFQVAALWVMGWLLMVFGITIGLAWYAFGYLDLATVGEMCLLLLPLLGAAIIVVVVAGRRESSVAMGRQAIRSEKEVERDRETSVAGMAAWGSASASAGSKAVRHAQRD